MLSRTLPAVIFTADDFGLHERVNEAVTRAYRKGVLTCASLMVAGPAAGDAIRRAQSAPGLRVGLHVVLADGFATLPPGAIPALADAEGRFGDRLVRNGFRYFFLPHVRRQLEAEIRAQFDAFRATGLALDHVNTHKHLHLHPTVLSILLRIGPQYGMRAMRLPFEADAPFWLKPWMQLVKWRLRRAGIAHNDRVAGIGGTGQMDEAAVLAVLADLSPGVTEVYCHPAVGDAPLTATMAGYRHADELDALLSARVRQQVVSGTFRSGSFADIFGRHAPAARSGEA